MIQNNARVSTFLLLFIIILEVLVSTTSQGKDTKAVEIYQKEVKLSLASCDLIIHIENLTDSIIKEKKKPS